VSESREWIRGLPKPELHVHLEGTITLDSYTRIAQRNGIEVGDDAAKLFACHDFDSFLRAFLRVVRALRQPVDFADLAYEYLSVSARNGVRHVEFFMSPATQRKFVPDLDLEATVSSIHDARTKAQREFGISSLVLFDMVRNLGETEAYEDIALAQRCREYDVIGVGLGGDERNFPARDFRGAFGKARELGLRRTVHAGEAAGPGSITDAVELLQAERIGHGVSARQERSVMEMLRARGIAIDACPTSNLVTGAVRRPETHPLNDFLNEGLLVTLSSDDPGFFGVSLLDEYAALGERGFSRELLAQLARNGFVASFAPDEQKKRWLGEVSSYLR
jgi:aminodeoxyfutalosine deaminase